MIQRIDEPVSVTTFFEATTNTIFPKVVIWKNRSYPITRLGLHHHYRHGTTLYHIFSVASHSHFFRLKLDTTSLRWILEEISDEQSN